jgi:type II secretory ATPase GspE/PulE/Tfp pilus assembly ATPase PilB-like protein
VIGNTFARYLRGFLRQDPDVILIGEMRDEETANIGIQAAITGHLLFSTLHTNDTISTASRLLMLGIEPDLLATALLCVVSQRLVRRICEKCYASAVPPKEMVEEFFPEGVPEGTQFARGQGCAACEFTGFKGRLPIFEFWAPDSRTKAAIRRGIDESTLAEYAFQGGMSSMLEDGLRKVMSGQTTLEELRTVIPLSQIHWYQSLAEKAAEAALEVGS